MVHTYLLTRKNKEEEADWNSWDFCWWPLQQASQPTTAPALAPGALEQLCARKKAALIKESMQVGGQSWLKLGTASKQDQANWCLQRWQMQSNLKLWLVSWDRPRMPWPTLNAHSGPFCSSVASVWDEVTIAGGWESRQLEGTKSAWTWTSGFLL